ELSRCALPCSLMAGKTDAIVDLLALAAKELLRSLRMRIIDFPDRGERIINQLIEFSATIAQVHVGDINEQAEQGNQEHWKSRFASRRCGTIIQTGRAGRRCNNQ